MNKYKSHFYLVKEAHKMLTDKNITLFGKSVVWAVLAIAATLSGAFAFKLVAEGLAIFH